MPLSTLVFQAETQLPTVFGSFRFRVYKNAEGAEAMAIATRGLENHQEVPVRVHSACFTAEVMGSLKCDCKQQLDYALEYIAEHGGVVLYLPQEGRGIGLSNKIRAYALQEDGHDTIQANHLLGLPIDGRCYDDAAFMLNDLGIRRVQLLTNNPSKLEAIRGFGFSVTGRIPVPATANHHSHSYLETKRALMGHMLDSPVFKTTDKGVAKHHAGPIRRPFVHINFAIDKAGRMNQLNGQAAELSCAVDWQRVHELRERYSAVVVGARTWTQDKPQLTVRQDRLGREPRRQPDRVIFAGQTPCCVESDSRRSFVVGLAANAPEQCIAIDSQDRSLQAPLETLFSHQVDTLLVEGGMTLLKSFIEQQMFDRMTIYVCAETEDQALSAVAEKFPELPITTMEYVPLGKGLLVSYTPNQMDMAGMDPSQREWPSDTEAMKASAVI